jgi:hypothetical protein
LRHTLPDALIPFVTQAGIMAGSLFAGSVVVEQVFAVRIPDDRSFEFDSRGRCIVRAGQWKLRRNGHTSRSSR